MKAITQRGYGTTDVLEFESIDEPPTGDDQLLVRVEAAGLAWACGT